MKNYSKRRCQVSRASLTLTLSLHSNRNQDVPAIIGPARCTPIPSSLAGSLKAKTLLMLFIAFLSPDFLFSQFFGDWYLLEIQRPITACKVEEDFDLCMLLDDPLTPRSCTSILSIRSISMGFVSSSKLTYLSISLINRLPLLTFSLYSWMPCSQVFTSSDAFMRSAS